MNQKSFTLKEFAATARKKGCNMKSLVFFFSNTGHNEILAQELQKYVPAELEKIKDYEKRNFFRDSFYALIQKKVRIEPPINDINNFERIFFVTPIWAGNFPAPVSTLLKQFKDQFSGKELYLVSVSGYGEKNIKIVQKFKKLTGADPKDFLLIGDDELKERKFENKLQKFAAKITGE